MQYMMAIYEHESDMSRRNDPDEAGPYWGVWMDYVAALNAAGITRGGNGLAVPATATTLRMQDGKRLVQDGPFADSKEQLGGYFILDVPDLDTALAWAAKCPALPNGAVEIRPVLPPPPGA